MDLTHQGGQRIGVDRKHGQTERIGMDKMHGGGLNALGTLCRASGNKSLIE